MHQERRALRGLRGMALSSFYVPRGSCGHHRRGAGLRLVRVAESKGPSGIRSPASASAEGERETHREPVPGAGLPREAGNGEEMQAGNLAAPPGSFLPISSRQERAPGPRMLLPQPRPEGQARTPPGSPQAPRRAASGAQRLPCAWLAPEWRVGSS